MAHYMEKVRANEKLINAPYGTLLIVLNDHILQATFKMYCFSCSCMLYAAQVNTGIHFKSRLIRHCTCKVSFFSVSVGVFCFCLFLTQEVILPKMPPTLINTLSLQAAAKRCLQHGFWWVTTPVATVALSVLLLKPWAKASMTAVWTTAAIQAFLSSLRSSRFTLNS